MFKKQPSGEILLRLTYKAYVEDEEDEVSGMKFVDTDASDDELDGDLISSTSEQSQIDGSGETERESFMDVLAALLVSEEFQGIVASDTSNFKVFEGSKSPTTTRPRTPLGSNTDNSLLENENTAGGFIGNEAVKPSPILSKMLSHYTHPCSSISFHFFLLCRFNISMACGGYKCSCADFD